MCPSIQGVSGSVDALQTARLLSDTRLLVTLIIIISEELIKMMNIKVTPSECHYSSVKCCGKQHLGTGQLWCLAANLHSRRLEGARVQR